MNPELMMQYNSIFGQNDTKKGFLSYNVYRLETPLLVYPACGGVYFFKSPIGLFKCSSELVGFKGLRYFFIVIS